MIKEITVKDYAELLREIGEENIDFGLLPSTVTLQNNNEIIMPGRVDLVLNRMEELGYVSESEKEETIQDLINFSFSHSGLSRADGFLIHELSNRGPCHQCGIDNLQDIIVFILLFHDHL